jgi:acyl-CoA thioester hydrolase
MPTAEALLADFPVVVAYPVQWGEQDAFGHVNNIVYFRWFESARIEYLTRLGFTGGGTRPRLGPILAAISCDYRRQLTYPDTVHVGAKVVRIGRTSIAIEHRIASERQSEVVADGKSTVVIYDYAAGRPHPAPDDLRQAISKLEGKVL